MKNTVKAPLAPDIMVFITALAINTDYPSETPNEEPPLKKHQQTHKDKQDKVIYVGLFGSKCSLNLSLNLPILGLRNIVVTKAPIPAEA